jgi:ABC-type phosphate/phosphonate transport system substrate-binding protein
MCLYVRNLFNDATSNAGHIVPNEWMSADNEMEASSGSLVISW